jgi:hypothetical protein
MGELIGHEEIQERWSRRDGKATTTTTPKKHKKANRKGEGGRR